ncbi:very short patch repair endonuclease [Rhizobium croatiense]|uniref:Very short patch repair endonuclease n=1 Tax=Rhizobium croatiense TaxID=2867516 RepID=A0ABS7M3U2_9HYPH|nr:DNA mismatch endonuclease Vsr [Rhizobium croatiense]MBY4631588.1 DNA mismatch endonuclease Vsr [Rhizobium croatiense]
MSPVEQKSFRLKRPDFADVPESRRRNMSAIRPRHTKPEHIVRQLLHRLGYRFRLHRKDLPGHPDIVFPGRWKVIFVHGCFWHRHGCGNSVLPRTRREWWEAKLHRNVERDEAALAGLRKLGWSPLVIWECEIGDKEALAQVLHKHLGPPGSRTV